MRFVDFARAHGLEIRDLYPSDKIRRCGTVDKPRSTNGAYFWDGERGWVFNWAADAKVQWFQDENAKPWTEEDKARWKQKRQAANAKQDESHEKAAKRAEEMLSKGQMGEHNYLHLKGFPEVTGIVLDDMLLIPMRNVITNKIQGVQTIRWIEQDRRYEKKMIYGMKAKGAVFRFGSPQASETFLCEGYATGLSIQKALRSIGLNASVLVCFSANNMEYVAGLVKGKRYIYADNDVSGAGEKAAKATGLPYCMSDTVGNDANDDHLSKGVFEVCRKIMQVRM